MLIVNKLLARGAGLAPALVRRAVPIELDWDTRQKSRFDAVDATGRAVAVFLPRGSQVRGGDVLVADDGSLLRVAAALQPVLTVTACAAHGSPFDLVRAAYHLGNRHVPLELQPDRLQLEPDAVLADLLRAMHLTVTTAHAPFEPEGGAYAASGAPHHHSPADGHAHDDMHGHGHGHEHGLGDSDAVAKAQEPPPAPAAATMPRKPVPIAVRAAPHVHGPGCSHGHADDHAPGHTH